MIYKIALKVAANRLKLIPPEIISAEESVFVTGSPGHRFLGARASALGAQRLSASHQQSHASSGRGPTIVACRRLALAAVGIIRRSKEFDVISIMFVIIYKFL